MTAIGIIVVNCCCCCLGYFGYLSRTPCLSKMKADFFRFPCYRPKEKPAIHVLKAKCENRFTHIIIDAIITVTFLLESLYDTTCPLCYDL